LGCFGYYINVSEKPDIDWSLLLRAFAFEGFGTIRNGWTGFPPLSAPKTGIVVLKNSEKSVATDGNVH
jgi:hypothetical protein